MGTHIGFVLLVIAVGVAVGAPPEDQWDERVDSQSNNLAQMLPGVRATADWITGMLGAGHPQPARESATAASAATAATAAGDQDPLEGKSVTLAVHGAAGSCQGMNNAVLRYLNHGTTATIYTIDGRPELVLKKPDSAAAADTFPQEQQTAEYLNAKGIATPVTTVCEMTYNQVRTTVLIKQRLMGATVMDTIQFLTLTPSFPGCFGDTMDTAGLSELVRMPAQTGVTMRYGDAQYNQLKATMPSSALEMGNNRRTRIYRALTDQLNCMYKIFGHEMSANSIGFEDMGLKNMMWGWLHGQAPTTAKLWVVDTQIIHFDRARTAAPADCAREFVALYKRDLSANARLAQVCGNALRNGGTVKPGVWQPYVLQSMEQFNGVECAAATAVMSTHSLSYDNVAARAPTVQLKLTCQPDSIRTQGAGLSQLNMPKTVSLNLFSSKGQSSSIYKLNDKFLVKLPINAAQSNGIRDEKKATHAMAQLGLNVPETFFCQATDLHGNNQMNALVKAMLSGYDLSDMLVGLSTTGIGADNMCEHAGCPILNGAGTAPVELTKAEYAKMKQMDGSRWSSFWSQRSGTGNRRNNLGLAVKAGLECAYKKIAQDNIRMLTTNHWRLFGDLKPDNFRWGKAAGDATEKLYVLDTVLSEYESGRGDASMDAGRRTQYNWKVYWMMWEGMDETAPGECHGPHWAKWNPEMTAQAALTKFNGACA